MSCAECGCLCAEQQLWHSLRTPIFGHNPPSVQHTGIPVPASSPVLAELKSIWALALWSNILNKEPCEAISWGVGCVWLSLKPFVTRTTGKTPASQRTYSLHFLVGFSIALKARVKIILKVGGEKGGTQKHDCTQPSETNVYMSQVFMS